MQEPPVDMKVCPVCGSTDIKSNAAYKASPFPEDEKSSYRCGNGHVFTGADRLKANAEGA